MKMTIEDALVVMSAARDGFVIRDRKNSHVYSAAATLLEKRAAQILKQAIPVPDEIEEVLEVMWGDDSDTATIVGGDGSVLEVDKMALPEIMSEMLGSMASVPDEPPDFVGRKKAGKP